MDMDPSDCASAKLSSKSRTFGCFLFFTTSQQVSYVCMMYKLGHKLDNQPTIKRLKMSLR